MNKVTCIYTPQSKVGKFVVIYNMHEWPERVLKSRGWIDKKIIFERPTTKTEDKVLQKIRLEQAYCYNDIEKLIEDELFVEAIDEKGAQKLREKLKKLEPTL